MKAQAWKWVERLRELLRETTPPPEQIAFRLQAVERDIILPVKAVFVGILLYYLYISRWFEEVTIPRSVVQQVIERFFLFYLVLNVVVAFLLIYSRSLPSPFTRVVMFTNSIVDSLFLAALTFATGGFDSILYWLFLGLNVRNALSVPLAVPQILLNLAVLFSYLGAGLLDMAVEDEMELMPNPTEPFLLRLIVLWLVAACCYGVQVLFEKHRQAQDEAREFSSRQAQLQSAGRLAAQIAHQLKNPLGIINNAAFSIQRALQEGKPTSAKQVQIIREEVDRSDRILTRLMGYAQLAEGQVERLNVVEALDRAISEVFPKGGPFQVQVDRDFEPNLPPLLMQRAHLSEVFVNLLQNAREVLGGKGRVRIKAWQEPDQSLMVTIGDSGPGIAPDQMNRIFNPYYTTKDKGTGLGLAIVKNNVEMYSGSVKAESELGKGTLFTIRLPTRTFMKMKA